MLDIQDLSVSFVSYSSGLKRQVTQAIRSLDLHVAPGQVVAVVGQSGAGKSLLAHALLGILPRNSMVSGAMTFKGREMTPAMARRLRGREMALIPQSVSYLNPLLRVGVQVARSGRLGGMGKRDAKEATRDAFERYGLARKVSSWFPFQLSGGMARRVLTATATIGKADLLLADEPTNGLDPAAARESLGHLRELADTGKAVVLITHDIESALLVADRVTVFCGGVTVEDASSNDFTDQDGLRHPYSRTLWSSLPGNMFTEALAPLGSGVRNGGCPFSHLCSQRDENCINCLPDFKPERGGKVRCWRA